MDSEIDRILKNIFVITEVSHNDKLMTNGDYFYIYTPTSMRGIMRYWSGEDRTHNVERIRQTIHSAFACVQTSMPDKMLSNQNNFHSGVAFMKHYRIIKALDASKKGLSNMISTYHDDAMVRGQLQIILDEVEDFLTVLDFSRGFETPDLLRDSTTKVQNSEMVSPHSRSSTRQIGAIGE